MLLPAFFHLIFGAHCFDVMRYGRGLVLLWHRSVSRARFSPNFHYTYVIPNRLPISPIFQWIVEGIPNSKEGFNSTRFFYFSSQSTFSILYVSCVNICLETFYLLGTVYCGNVNRTVTSFYSCYEKRDLCWDPIKFLSQSLWVLLYRNLINSNFL